MNKSHDLDDELKPSKSILDQVDEYLNDADNFKDNIQSEHIDWSKDKSYQQASGDLFESLFTHQAAGNSLSGGRVSSKDTQQIHDTDVWKPREVYEQTSAVLYSPKLSPSIDNNAMHGTDDTPFLHASSYLNDDIAMQAGLPESVIDGSGVEKSKSSQNTPYMGTMNGNSRVSNSLRKTKSSNYDFSPLTSPALISIEDPGQFLVTQSSISGGNNTRLSNISTRGKVGKKDSVSSTSKIAKHSPYLSTRKTNYSDSLKGQAVYDISKSAGSSHIGTPTALQKVSSESSKSNLDDIGFQLPESSFVNKANIDVAVDNFDDHSISVAMNATSKSQDGYNNALNYPKVVLPSNKKNSGSSEQQEAMDDNIKEGSHDGPQDTNIRTRILFANESPVIQPRRPSIRRLSKRYESASDLGSIRESEQQNNLKHGIDVGSSYDSGTMHKTISNDYSHSRDKYMKKEVHKAAEQERRNRLNNALNDLSSLLPQEWKAEIAVPSKAITAELGCRYIRDLLKEIENLKASRTE